MKQTNGMLVNFFEEWLLGDDVGVIYDADDEIHWDVDGNKIGAETKEGFTMSANPDPFFNIRRIEVCVREDSIEVTAIESDGCYTVMLTIYGDTWNLEDINDAISFRTILKR